MTDWSLSDEENDLLDARLDGEGPLPEGWRTFHLAVPNDFHDLMMETIHAYKILRETQHIFPALEAIVMEARNALPQEILNLVSQKK